MQINSFFFAAQINTILKRKKPLSYATATNLMLQILKCASHYNKITKLC